MQIFIKFERVDQKLPKGVKLGKTIVIWEKKCSLTPPLFLPWGQKKIQQKFYCHE